MGLQGLFEPPRLAKQVAQQSVAVGIGGIALHQDLRLLERRFHVLGNAQFVDQFGPKFMGVRALLQCLAIGIEKFFPSLGPHQEVQPVVVGRVQRLEVNRPLKCIDGLVRLAQGRIGAPQVLVDVRQVRVDGDRPLRIAHRLCIRFTLPENNRLVL